MVTPCFPFRLMLSSLSKVTPGDFSRTSMAVEPALEGEASTLIMVRSAFVSMNGFLPTTAIACRLLELEDSTSGERLWVPVTARSKGGEYVVSNPTDDAVTRYFPAGTWSNRK